MTIVKSVGGRNAGARLPWVSWGAAALAGFGIKLHYSRASAEDLGWILGPTARLVGGMRGETLALIPGAGWAPADGTYVIAPACAGVNFLILALSVTVFGFAHRLSTRRARLAGWIGALAGAWLLTVGVNALRIVAAVELYRLGPVGGVSAAQLHRLLGVAVYLGALWGLYAVLDRWIPGADDPIGSPVGAAPCGRPGPRLTHRAATRGRPYDAQGQTRSRNQDTGPRSIPSTGPRPRGALLVPLLYLGMTVGIPLLRAAFRGGDGRTVEHAMIVTGATVTAAGAVALAGGMRRRSLRRRETT